MASICLGLNVLTVCLRNILLRIQKLKKKQNIINLFFRLETQLNTNEGH